MSRILLDLRRVMSLAWPVMLSMLSYSLMSAADAVFVGQQGTVSLAAIGLAVNATFLFLGLPIGLVRGVRVAVAQATGAERTHSAHALGWQAVWLGVLCGAAVAALGGLGAPVFRALGATPEVQAEALLYFNVRVYFAPITLLALALTSWFEGRGDTRTPMRANVTANLLCIALDAILVPGLGPIPAYGIRGAAWAGVISMGVAATWLFWAAWPVLRSATVRPRRTLLAEASRLGLPIGAQRMLDILAWTLLTGVIASVSDDQMAAHVVAIRVLLLCFLPALAIAEATAVLVGQAVGARDMLDAIRAWRAGLVAALMVMSLGALAFVLAPGLFISPFGASAEVAPIARQLLLVAAAFMLIDAVATVTYFSLDGAGDTRFTLAASVSLAWLVKLPLGVGLALYGGMGAVGAWLGLTLELFVLAAVLGWRWRSRRWYPARASEAPQLQVSQAAST